MKFLETYLANIEETPTRILSDYFLQQLIPGHKGFSFFLVDCQKMNSAGRNTFYSSVIHTWKLIRPRLIPDQQLTAEAFRLLPLQRCIFPAFQQIKIPGEDWAKLHIYTVADLQNPTDGRWKCLEDFDLPTATTPTMRRLCKSLQIIIFRQHK